MADMRRTPNGPEIRESRSVDLDGKRLDEIAEYLTTKAEGLVDARLDIEADVYYDSPVLHQHVSGWRPATDAEVREHAQERSGSEQRVRARQEQQFAQLKKDRPDLFQ